MLLHAAGGRSSWCWSPLLARRLGATAGVSLRTGLYLAQAGEFGFVLLSLARRGEPAAALAGQPVLASMVLSMLATPFIILYSNAHRAQAGGQRLDAAVAADDRDRAPDDQHRAST